jgi:hypothetical protein
MAWHARQVPLPALSCKALRRWPWLLEAGLGERPTIVSLSLGGVRRFQFRHRRTKETITLELKSGDWLMMRGETQRFWVHQVPKTASPVDPRVNLTFRRVSAILSWLYRRYREESDMDFFVQALQKNPELAIFLNRGRGVRRLMPGAGGGYKRG